MSGTCNGHHYKYLGLTALPSVISTAGEQTVYHKYCTTSLKTAYM